MEEFTFEFMAHIVDKALVLIPVLLIVGGILKATPQCPDWCIPWVLTGAGVVLSVQMLGFTADAVIQGTLAAGAAVYGNQLYKQTKGKS